MSDWQHALSIFADAAPDDVRWMLVGSAATRLHGADVDPADVDILVHPETPDDALLRLASCLSDHAVDGPASQSLEHFMSARDQSLLAAGAWLFGRWMIDGYKLEVARIREPVDPLSLLETQGLVIWSVREVVQWRGRSVPVVPLEVQLATVVLRGQAEREESVRAALTERGFDHELQERAMVARGLNRHR